MLIRRFFSGSTSSGLSKLVFDPKNGFESAMYSLGDLLHNVSLIGKGMMIKLN